MRHLIIQFALCIHLLAPAIAAAEPGVKDPLNYPIKQYGFILGVALLGGLVSWYSKVRKGDTTAANLGGLIGELATSAFAGLLAFWGCEYYNLPPLMTAALAGLAGHAGGSGIAWLEALAKRRAEKALDVKVDQQ